MVSTWIRTTSQVFWTYIWYQSWISQLKNINFDILYLIFVYAFTNWTPISRKPPGAQDFILIPTIIRFVSPKNPYCDTNMQYQILVEGPYTWIRAGSRCSIFHFKLPLYVILYFGVWPRSVKPLGALNFIFDIRIWFVSPKNLN